MSKSAILTSLGMLALGYTKDRIGSKAKKMPISKFPAINVSFMDWAPWLNFDEEVLANFNTDYLESLQFTHIILPNPFPEADTIKLHFNEIGYDDSGINLRMFGEAIMKPNTFLDLKENRESRIKMDEFGEKLWKHITYYITQFVRTNLPPVLHGDDNAEYFEQYEGAAPEDWLASSWNPEESTLFEDTDFPSTYGKHELYIDLNENTYIFQNNRWNLIDTYKNKRNPSKLRRR